jgi:hypothetical protein
LSLKDNILKEAKRVKEDCDYSSEEHFIAACRWSKYHWILGLPTAALAVLSGSSALSQFDNHNILAGIFAMAAALLAAVSTFLNPNQRASCHLNAGNNYRKLRNDTQRFCEIDFLKDADVVLEKKVKLLAKRRDALNMISPQPPEWAYKKAEKRIIEGKTKYEVDK